MLIGVFLNMILYGVRSWSTRSSVADWPLGGIGSGMCRQPGHTAIRSLDSFLFRRIRTIRIIKGEPDLVAILFNSVSSMLAEIGCGSSAWFVKWSDAFYTWQGTGPVLIHHWNHQHWARRAYYVRTSDFAIWCALRYSSNPYHRIVIHARNTWGNDLLPDT